MIRFEFTVRPGQGEPSGFDLGDITVYADRAAVTSAGHVPDQGMMIYLALSTLLDQLAVLKSGPKKRIEFIGTDSSFTLRFKRDNGDVEISAPGGKVGRVPVAELFGAVLRGAEKFATDQLRKLPREDAGGGDLLASLEAFRRLVP